MDILFYQGSAFSAEGNRLEQVSEQPLRERNRFERRVKTRPAS